MTNRPALMTLLRYKRPEGSVTQEYFCEKYLEPVMGEPDKFGNYIHIIPDEDGLYPEVCFAAHHDTVHKTEGVQTVFSMDNMVYSEGGECLGADCTTGVWLILEMIAERVPGIYVIHAGEEVGCLGSSALVESNPEWLYDLKAVISFDRMGTDSIITHQMGYRTASEEFSQSLAAILRMGFKSDDGGSYTDSNEYAEIVPECTNISVGYYAQHTAKEHQDISFAYKLRDALIAADWSKLVYARDPSIVEPLYYRSNKFTGWPTMDDYDTKNYVEDCYDVEDVVRDFPGLIAELLVDWGFNRETLMQALEDVGTDDPDFISQRQSWGAH